MGEERVNQATGGHVAGASLGTRLRRARQAQRRTLASVAEASGLTKGYLSKVENDQANASVASLMRVCASLEVPVGSLFEPGPGSVVRSTHRPPIEFGGVRMREYALTPRSEQRMQALLSEIEPGGGSGSDQYVLPTDVEFAYVLDGSLEIALTSLADGDEWTVHLDAGDAFTFPADNRHGFRAVAESGPTRVLWVFSPALATRTGGNDAGTTRQDG